jgi:hypothetical protein
MTITEFLLARIAEDEDAAHGAEDVSPSPWLISAYSELADATQGHIAQGEHPLRHTTIGFIAWNHPARVLRECEAKRRIIELHPSDGHALVPDCETCTFEHGWPCATLRALAAVYSDHPDYRQEWTL